MSRSIDAGRNRGRRLAIPAAIAKNVRADLNIAGLPALWEILHTLVWCDVLKSTAQLKAEAGFEPQVSEAPWGKKAAHTTPDRMMGLAEPAGLRHVRAPAFMFIGPPRSREGPSPRPSVRVLSWRNGRVIALAAIGRTRCAPHPPSRRRESTRPTAGRSTRNCPERRERLAFAPLHTY